MKTFLLWSFYIYLAGVVVTFIMLHKEVRDKIYSPKYLITLSWKVLKNCHRFYFTSWYGALLIYLNRKIQ